MFTKSEETSHQHAISDVSGGPYYNCSVKRGTETYAANLILYGNLRQLQTVKNLAPCFFAANDKQLWITYHTLVTNLLQNQFNKGAAFRIISIT